MKHTLRLWLWRLPLRVALGLAGIGLGYLGVSAVLVLEPKLTHIASPPKAPPAAVDTVTIHVSYNSIHADLILPMHHAIYDWQSVFPAQHFPAPSPKDQWIAIGWGSQAFYLETRNWSDLRLSTALQVGLGFGASLLHVTRTTQDTLVQTRALSPRNGQIATLSLSTTQYQRLVEGILQDISQVQGQAQPILGAHYSSNDAFFKSPAKYHLLNTCNTWAGAQLRSVGVPMSRWTPLAWQVGANLSPAAFPLP